jgi:hypothetical protein
MLWDRLGMLALRIIELCGNIREKWDYGCASKENRPLPDTRLWKILGNTVC